MRRRCIVLAVVSVVGLVGCDHATKDVAQRELRNEPPVTLVSGVLDLRYAENRGVGFNALRWVPEEIRTPLIFGVRLVAIPLLLLLWYQSRRRSWVAHLPFVLFFAGSLGNFLDQIRRGYVVDFVHLHHWPIFNAADVYLTLGVALLLLFSMRRQAPEPEPG